MTTMAGDALSHVVICPHRNASRRVICGDARRREPVSRSERNRRLVTTAGIGSLAMHRRHELCAGERHPRTRHYAFRITCANLVAAHENFIRKYLPNI
jgi:hypothetical protein